MLWERAMLWEAAMLWERAMLAIQPYLSAAWLPPTTILGLNGNNG